MTAMESDRLSRISGTASPTSAHSAASAVAAAKVTRGSRRLPDGRCTLGILHRDRRLALAARQRAEAVERGAGAGRRAREAVGGGAQLAAATHGGEQRIELALEIGQRFAARA